MALPKPIPELTHKHEIRFRAKFNEGEASACWEWLCQKRPAGYGKFFMGRRAYGAHRIAAKLAFGDFPGNLSVCHRCDNPGCVNPSHLFLGTHKDNMADMISKKRGFAARKSWPTKKPKIRGSQHRSSKLKEADVSEIRNLRGVVKQRELAARFGVGEAQICRIQRGQQWTHLTE